MEADSIWGSVPTAARRLTAEHEAERRSSATFDLTRETNRMLLELWRMEDVERQDRMVVP